MIKRIKHAEYRGRETIDYWHGQGRKVMLDFKVYDIPEIVRKTLEVAKTVGADYLSLRDGDGKIIVKEL